MLAGIELYGHEYVKLRFDATFLDFTADIERHSKVLFDNQYLPRALFVETYAKHSLALLLQVQKWKTIYVDDRYEAFSFKPAREMAVSIYDFFQASTVAEKLSHLMRMTSEGLNLDGDSWRKALIRALSIARFLDPMHWAIVDWRILGVLGYRSMTDLKQNRIGSSVEKMRRLFEPVDFLDLELALEMIQAYRCDDLPRAVDVEFALYSISLDIWRPGLAKENLRRVCS